MNEVFDSLNPYQGLDVVTADSPQELVELLLAIRTPFKIIAIVPVGARQCAYISGELRSRKQNVKKKG